VAKKAGAGKWFLYGCFGCLGLVAFMVMIVIGLAGIASLQVGKEEISSESITPDLPVSSMAPGSADLPDAVGARDSNPTMPDLRALEPDAAALGRVVIEAARSEVQVEPAQPGEPLRVEASYDKSSYELQESVEMNEDGTWVYLVKFKGKSTGFGLMATLKQLVGGSSPSVKVFLPRDVPLDLEATTTQGGLEMELGGLWLRNAEIEFQQGGAAIEFSEPLRAPMDSLAVNGSMGGVAIMEVGNASPGKVDFSFSMGGGLIDLRGPWQNDSEISLSANMGGGEVRLPKDLAIEGLDLDSSGPKSTAELPMPTLRFKASESTQESLKFRR
jgi:hypothetical protein